MSRAWVRVTRTKGERRVPRRVRPRMAVEALCQHLGVRLELDYHVLQIGPPVKRVTVVPEEKEAE